MRDERLYENLKIWTPELRDCEGAYQIPAIRPVTMPHIDAWLPANYALSRRIHKGVGIQMYVHDNQIVRYWFDPRKYVQIVTSAGCVLTPDYSLYTNVPMALNLYNHYRKHWLGAWWQRMGATVVPTICWAGEDSFAWCFDGEPVGGVVSVSSVGTQRDADDKRRFMAGYDAMLERLRPEAVLFFGTVPEGARGNICPVEAFYHSIERRREKV